MSEPAGLSDPWREPYRPEDAGAAPASPHPPHTDDRYPAWSGTAAADQAWPPSPAWQQHPGGSYAPWGTPMNAEPGAAWIQSQDAAAARSNAMIALIVSCVCLGIITAFAVPSIVLSALALTRADSDPRSARHLTRWAWGVLAVIVGLGAALLVFAFLFVIALGS